MAWLVKLSSRVCPSGAALATASAAMLPPAPGLFSTMTVRPSAGPMLTASERASVSVEPPAGAPTRMRTGALPICARAWVASVNDASAAGVMRMSRRFIIVSLIFRKPAQSPR